jgi:hypothetical protein
MIYCNMLYSYSVSSVIKDFTSQPGLRAIQIEIPRTQGTSENEVMGVYTFTVNA